MKLGLGLNVEVQLLENFGAFKWLLPWPL